MKNRITTCMLCAAFLLAYEGKSQFTFSASPGLHLNGASFGFRTGNVVPFIGMQVLGGSESYQYTYTEYDAQQDKMVRKTDKYSTKLTAIIPVVGARLFFKGNEKIKPYVLLCFSKVFVTGKAEDSDDPTVKENFDKDKKQAKIYGAQFGFGTEYFFDDNFSIGGEFGLRMFNGSLKMERPDEVYDPNLGDYVSTTTVDEVKISASPTYTKFSFNFYFN